MSSPYLVEKFEDWFDKWDATKDPEVRRLCGITWDMARTVVEPQPVEDIMRIYREALDVPKSWKGGKK